MATKYKVHLWGGIDVGYANKCVDEYFVLDNVTDAARLISNRDVQLSYMRIRHPEMKEMLSMGGGYEEIHE